MITIFATDHVVPYQSKRTQFFLAETVQFYIS